MSWSGGKDCAIALHSLQACGDNVAGLLTTVSGDRPAVSHHGVPVDLVRAQADAIGLPLHIIALPAGVCPPEVYAETMRREMNALCESGVSAIGFGDIFLEDLRQWREQNLATVGLRALFPIWKQDTRRLARSFIDAGFRARLVSVQAKLGADFIGRLFDDSLLTELPADVDPCGENGEFHTFVFDGPLFANPIGHAVGDVTGDGDHLHVTLALPATT